MAKKTEQDALDESKPGESGSPSVETVKMTREEPAHPGGPNEADVHPDQVSEFQAAGWRVAK